MQSTHDPAVMKTVYSLEEDLRHDPSYADKVRRVTLDPSKPTRGLKGQYGLFATPEWWQRITSGDMPLLRLAGIIRRAYVAGQDPDEINTVDLQLEDGSSRAVGIYLLDKSDLQFFKVGHRASIVYALDPLKRQPDQDGQIAYSKVALEMSVSTTPVATESFRID